MMVGACCGRSTDRCTGLVMKPGAQPFAAATGLTVIAVAAIRQQDPATNSRRRCLVIDIGLGSSYLRAAWTLRVRPAPVGRHAICASCASVFCVVGGVVERITAAAQTHDQHQLWSHAGTRTASAKPRAARE